MIIIADPTVYPCVQQYYHVLKIVEFRDDSVQVVSKYSGDEMRITFLVPRLPCMQHLEGSLGTRPLIL